MDFEFEPNNVVAKAILSPHSFKDIIRDLDSSSTNVLITLNEQYISFFTDGDLGKIKVDLNKNLIKNIF